MEIFNFSKLLKFYIGLRNRHLFVLDVFGFVITPLFALDLLLESWNFHVYQVPLLLATMIFIFVKVSVFYTGDIYRRDWRYAGIGELGQLAILACTALFVQTWLFSAVAHLNSPLVSLPDSLPLLDGIVSLLWVGGVRFSIPLLDRLSRQPRTNTKKERILVMGAGQSGVLLVEQMQRNPNLRLEPVAFVDDDPHKLNLRIRGLTVMGDRESIPSLVGSLDIDRVMIAMSTASGEVIREIVNVCETIKVKTSIIPSINKVLNGRFSLNQVREVSIEDLLRREPIQTDVDKISEFLRGKKVLITGAGGSIGSELCRQVLKCRPCEMVLLGHGENSIFNIQQELGRLVLELKRIAQEDVPLPLLTAYIADIRARDRLEYIFEKFRPDVVFHAAAHKHVPMMELNPPEAITNNVQGTKNLVELALKYDVQNFVMVSTDKAVNPTNIMGCSKRIAEMLVLQAAKKSGRAFVVVRFGNVLGSRGSVVPTFKNQIAQGGPITITHPDICRYFMTIPEAVQLLLQAAILGHRGQVFMLNMGKPVKILDLAKDLIRLSGYEVGKDIDIIFTGLRPGEKLFEELFVPGETYQETQHEKIFILGNASRIIPEDIEEKVKLLCGAAENNDSHLIVFYLGQLVHEYIPGYASAIANEDMSSKGSQLPTTFLTPADLELAKDLKLALERQEFRLYYQPIIEMENNQTIGFEALLRWEHPQRALIPPSEFLPVAEETGLIIPIGLWVIHEACRQITILQRQFPMNPPLTISVNLTKKQFFQPDLSHIIAQILKENELEPSSLQLEIGEKIITQNEAANAIFVKLKTLGVQLLIDNCGNNHSSVTDLYNLLRLKYGKFDSIKLDRSLISSLEKSPDNIQTIHEMLGVAQELGMQMIVMGIETAGQMSQMTKMKCVYGQGHFFSEPLPGDATIKLVTPR